MLNPTAVTVKSIKEFLILEFHAIKSRMVDAASLRKAFERDGVLVLPGFFSPSELVTTRLELDGYFAPFMARAKMEAKKNAHKGNNDTACDVVPWNPIKEGNRVFMELHRHGGMAHLTEIVLGPGYTDPGSLVMYSVGGGRGQAWHQDCPVDDPHAYNLNRLIYVDDVTLEDGAIVVVPGSHKQGPIPPGGHQDPMEGEVILTPRAGTLALLHGHVYHRVTPNLNSKPRISVNFRAFAKGISPDVTCVGVYRNGTVNFCDQPKQHDGTPAKNFENPLRRYS